MGKSLKNVIINWRAMMNIGEDSVIKVLNEALLLSYAFVLLAQIIPATHFHFYNVWGIDWLIGFSTQIFWLICILRIIYCISLNWRYIVPASILLLIGVVISELTHDHTTYYLLLIVIALAAVQIPFRKIVRVHMITMGFSILFVAVMTILGVVKEHSEFDEGRGILHYMGFYGHNYAMGYMVFVFAGIVYYFWNSRYKLWITALYSIITYIVYVYTISRSGMLVILMGEFCILCYMVAERFRFAILAFLKKLLSIILALMPTIAIIVTVIGVIICNWYYANGGTLENTMVNRFYFLGETMAANGVSMPFKEAQLVDGIEPFSLLRGGTIVDYNREGMWICVDNVYGSTLLMGGILAFALLFLLMQGISIAAYKKGDVRMLIIMSILSIFSLMEGPFTSYYISPYIMLAFANWEDLNINVEDTNWKKVIKQVKKRNVIIVCSVMYAIITLVLVILPKETKYEAYLDSATWGMERVYLSENCMRQYYRGKENDTGISIYLSNLNNATQGYVQITGYTDANKCLFDTRIPTAEITDDIWKLYDCMYDYMPGIGEYYYDIRTVDVPDESIMIHVGGIMNLEMDRLLVDDDSEAYKNKCIQMKLLSYKHPSEMLIWLVMTIMYLYILSSLLGESAKDEECSYCSLADRRLTWFRFSLPIIIGVYTVIMCYSDGNTVLSNGFNQDNHDPALEGGYELSGYPFYEQEFEVAQSDLQTISIYWTEYLENLPVVQIVLEDQERNIISTIETNDLSLYRGEPIEWNVEELQLEKGKHYYLCFFNSLEDGQVAPILEQITYSYANTGYDIRKVAMFIIVLGLSAVLLGFGPIWFRKKE